MHTLICTRRSPSVTVAFWTFGLNVRLVFGARRAQPPDAWWRMLRPNETPLAQTSHFAMGILTLLEPSVTLADDSTTSVGCLQPRWA